MKKGALSDGGRCRKRNRGGIALYRRARRSDNRRRDSAQQAEHGYEQANWSIDLTYDKVFVVYTLAVLPQLMNRGVASDLLRFAEDTARKAGMKAIRLDVVANNIPAIRLYEKLGFMCVGDFDLGYGKYGLDLFKLYEKNL